MLKVNFLFVFGVVVVALGVVSAVTDEEKESLIAAAQPYLEACEQEFGLTKDDVVAAKDSNNPDALDSCFYACFFQKIDVINADGLFNPDAVLERNKKHINGEEDLKNIEEIGKTCASVNDETVTDGTKGCERAKSLLSCFIKEKAAFTPFSA